MCRRRKVKEQDVAQQRQQNEHPAQQPEFKPVRVVYAKVQDGMIPAARASQHVQLTPIVTPIAMVPYMSTDTGLFVYADDDEEDEDEE